MKTYYWDIEGFEDPSAKESESMEELVKDLAFDVLWGSDDGKVNMEYWVSEDKEDLNPSKFNVKTSINVDIEELK